MKLAKILGICASALLLAAPLMAQGGARRHFSLLGQDQGLPAAEVQAMAQDTDGFLWMGTENGLIRYEGGQVRRWSTAEGLPATYVASILAAPGGGLWVATLKGLIRMHDGQMKPVLVGREPLTGNMAVDGTGRLWLATDKGLFIEREAQTFTFLAQVADMAKPMWAPRAGVMLIPSLTGLQAFRPDGSSRHWGPADGLPPGGLSLAAEDGSGRIWAGSGRTLVMKEPAADRFTDQSRLLDSSLSPNSTIYLDGDGSIWLPTQNGALRLNGEQRERLDAAGGLPFRWVRTVFRDREGTLWLLGPGVARLQGGRAWNYNLSGGLFGEIVWAVQRDADGSLLVGTDDGAARMGPAGLQRLPATEGHRVKGLVRDRQGILWMVGTIGGPMWLRPGSARAEAAPLGAEGGPMNSVMMDTRGQVLVGHARLGLLRWDAAQGRLVPEVPPAFTRTATLGVFKVVEDARGRLWAASDQGLLVKDLDGRWHQFGKEDGLGEKGLYSLAILPNGSAWVSYREPIGLTQVTVDAGRLTVVGQRPRKPDSGFSLIYAVQVDGLGQTWISTDQGLLRLEAPVRVGSLEGMVSEDCSLNALLVEQGRVWVGTSGGLVRVDLGGPGSPPAPPNAHILQLAFGSRKLEPPFDRIAVSHRDATVTFRIASPTYADEHGLHFQVRLHGLEDDWRDPETRLVSYPALPGGQYRFEVRAAVGDGAFGPATMVAFEVRPPWWKTSWAWLAEALLLLGAISSLVRVRVAALARSKAELEALVVLRTKELQGRNEELSTALGNVKQLSGLLPICAACKKIRDDSGYWNQLETYISRHSEADFSHGICPECADEMFPELAAAKRLQLPPT